MSDFELQRYVAAYDQDWDDLVRRSRNGNMLCLRGYMGYHAHRFDEQSLLVRRKGKVVAVFPANRDGDHVISHGGLTYGGLIYATELRAEGVLEVMERIRDHYAGLGARVLLYKAIPHVFHRYPCEEDLYALFRLDARLVRRDISSVVALDQRPSMSSSRRQQIRKAEQAGVIFTEEQDEAGFHVLLTETLGRIGVTPVHTLRELRLLRGRFPDGIRIFGASRQGRLLAGTLIYDLDHVVHTQYLASSEEGRNLGALDFLLAQLIEREFADKQYFSFGISTEQGGRVLNSGLIFQKEGFGGRGIVHDFYELDL
jgi:hypothetical protein